jgi:spectinomycin phosphotransferase
LKTEANDIDKAELLRLVVARYGYNLQSIDFLPKGEDAYSYVAEDDKGRRYFVRAQSPDRGAPQDSVYALLHRLHHKGGLSAAVAPHLNLEGTFTLRYGQYVVAVFRFIQGETLHARGASADDLAAAARIVAALHQSATRIEKVPLAKEAFDNPFKDPILAVLRGIESSDQPRDTVQRELRKLLVAERADLLRALDEYEDLGRIALASTSEWVITHGDPNLDNFLRDGEGQLHLTDWGELALGPPERDLFAFTGADFPAFLGPYTVARAGVRLNIDILAFYIFRWCVQEIADYTTRIMLQDLRPKEREHAWAELRPYLPIQREHVARGIDEAKAAIDQAIQRGR